MALWQPRNDHSLQKCTFPSLLIHVTADHLLNFIRKTKNSHLSKKILGTKHNLFPTISLSIYHLQSLCELKCVYICVSGVCTFVCVVCVCASMRE